MQSTIRAQNELHYYSDRLRRKLDGLRFAPATVVEAPSGYGKTTAIRDFLTAALPPSAPVYWFTATDELPAAGFRRLCREIDKIDSRAGDRLLKIELPAAATVGEACDALRCLQCRNETYLVIDNFQFLSDALPFSFTTSLLAHGGARLHVIVSPRYSGGRFSPLCASTASRTSRKRICVLPPTISAAIMGRRA